MPINATPLIGEQKSSPQIVVELIRTESVHTDKVSVYYTHRSMPEPESTDSKGPIGLPLIEAIEACVDTLSALTTQSAHFARRYKNNPGMLVAYLTYRRIRRHFMMWIVKRTGLRPSEMVRINIKYMKTF